MGIIAITNSWEAIQCPHCGTDVNASRTTITELNEEYMTLRSDCAMCKRLFIREYAVTDTKEDK